MNGLRTNPAHAWTRCDHCQSSLPIRFADLAQAGGMVRCGHCGRTFNALARLYPELPEEGDPPLERGGMPPMIQPATRQVDSSDMRAAETRDDTGEAGDRPVVELDLTPEPPSRWQRLLWPSLAAVLLVTAGLQIAGPESWRVDLPLPGLEPGTPVPAAEAISVVSRDMHAHPSLDDAWVISALLLNQSSRPVDWPTIELRLFDASQQVVAQRRVRPTDYLDSEYVTGTRFDPGLRLPVVLQVATEGSRPSGFSMQFLD